MRENAIDIYELLKVPLGQNEAKFLIDYIDESFESKAIKQVTQKIEHLALKENLADVKAELIKWLFIFISGQTVLIISLMKLL